MPRLINLLDIDRCPYCNVDKPLLRNQSNFSTDTHDKANQRFWRAYACSRCGGVVLAAAKNDAAKIIEMYPEATIVSDSIPSPAKDYLIQAIDTLHAPAGSVMLSASAVDAMLKSKSYKEGSLYTRINQAAKDHLITAEMSEWAHEFRLDANEPRHADDERPLPSNDDAKRCIEFILALAEFLFVLPSRVERGRTLALSDSKEEKASES